MEKLKDSCDISLPRNERVQDVFGMPSALSFPFDVIFREPSISSFQVCPKCQAKYIDRCPICTSCEIKSREINVSLHLKKNPIPLLIFINIENCHKIYITYFLQLLRQSFPTKEIVIVFHSDHMTILKTPHKEFILPENEWNINHNNYSFKASEMTDQFIDSLFNHIIPSTTIAPLLLDICTSVISHICLFTSCAIDLPQDISNYRKKLYHSSSSIDQFVFKMDKPTALSVVFSKDSNGHFYAYDQYTLTQFPKDILQVIQTPRLYNLRLVTILPGFEVQSMVPKSFTYSSDQTLTLFVNSINDHEEKYIQCQTQWYYQLENGDCCQCIINETFNSSNKILELYRSYQTSEYVINLAKFTLSKRNDILEDGRINFFKQLVGCMLNYYELSSISQFPFNRDLLGSICCHLLNSPAFSGDQSDVDHSDKNIVKCLIEREMITKKSWKELELYFNRDLYYIKVMSEDYKLVQTFNIPYQSERFIGQSWLIERKDKIATHLIFKESEDAWRIFGDKWYLKDEEYLIGVWKEIMDTNISNDPTFFDSKLRKIKYHFKVIEDYGELIPFCYDGMANLYRDEALFKINLLKRMDEIKRRNETTYLFPHA
ncbi:hypothetical protein ENUP19_0121G0164 [Entamoeba nuttalli]|uniref:Uncharacterized protein n=2 Tax=Entamoeba nuttalli TaxID=412467 RepID=K2I160_ENTNP|nr:hypothetical protein ENU1_019540 [Entamoeba nuttalli P19]EKE42490.1 hypothetical protein ENU1_019540 [Entamoeba nuttalli P19]|eukprot:XP_008855174.1 hypothetical protein ENU1_019540 [Entamoeba nuttalli P19]